MAYYLSDVLEQIDVGTVFQNVCFYLLITVMLIMIVVQISILKERKS